MGSCICLSVNLNYSVSAWESTRSSCIPVDAALSPLGLPPGLSPPPDPFSICCSHPNCRHPPTCPRLSHVPPCSPCCSWSPASSSELELGARAVPPGSSRPAPCTVPPGSSCRPTHPLSPSPSSAAPCRCHPLWAQVREDRPQPRSTDLGPGAGWGAMGGTGALDLWLRRGDWEPTHQKEKGVGG